MELIIANVLGAVLLEPKRPTHVISIHSSFSWLNQYHVFVEDPMFNVHRYVFDDIYPEDDKPGRLFSGDIAGQMLADFEEGSRLCDAVLVHCTFGRNRSPAVAMALNKLYGLGGNPRALRERYPGYNRWVYDTMMKKGLEARLGADYVRDAPYACRERRPEPAILR